MNKRRISILVCTLLLATGLNDSFSQSVSNASEYGSFDGPIVMEWLEHQGPDRKMRVAKAVTFRDRNGKEWTVPEKAIIDGASIPQFFWSLFGSPFVGDYRRASVIHDHFWKGESETWRAVNRMFYDAALAGGTPQIKAKAMYAALLLVTIRWEWLETTAFDGGEVEKTLVEVAPSTVSEEQFREIEKWIKSEAPNLDEIDEYVKKYEN